MNRLWEQTKTSFENRDYDLARMQITVMHMGKVSIIDEMERDEKRDDVKKQKKKPKNKETQMFKKYKPIFYRFKKMIMI